MTSSGAGGYSGPAGCEAIEIQVLCLNGEGCNFPVSGSTRGHEVRQMVLQRLPSKKGRRCGALYLENSPLLLDQTLQEQGIIGKTVTLSCTFGPTDLYAAFCYIKGLQVSAGECVLDGVTKLEGVSSDVYLQHLPQSLKTLAFHTQFNRRLQTVSLPSGLQSLTFANDFNQRLDGESLPSGLQNLTFGNEFNQRLDGVSLPSGLQSLTFGHRFNQTLDGVSLPSGLQSLTFGSEFNQRLHGVSLPSGLQSLTFGHGFNQTLDGVSLPSGLQSLSCGSVVASVL